MQMLDTVKNAWKVADLRKKILFTLFIVFIFRVGSVIPAPFIDFATLQTANSGSNASDFFSYYSVLSGGGLEYGAIFAMGVTPYINSSIIMQLLCVAIPPLERISQDGEEGRKKIAQYTRYCTVILGLIQAIAYFFYLKSPSAKNGGDFLTSFVSGGFSTWFAGIVIVATLTAGSALVMWLGEQIDKNGIGNGISILLFAGIISRFPTAVATLALWWKDNEFGKIVGVVVLFVVIIGFIVWMTDAERRIPIQYAKKVVGRKMYGGQSNHIPIKVNMSGVMPIIFASSILMLPTMILSFMGTSRSDKWIYKVLTMFSSRGLGYAVIYFVLIICFAYFYVTIQYNPVEMANNLRKSSGAIPGIRPGKPTAEFIKKILSRITLLGAILLSVIALLPIFMALANNNAISIGGTSILIVVGVALDTVKNLESQMMMRHYKGFLD